jgi:hypothetical protein
MQNYPLTESQLEDLAAQVDARVQRLEEEQPATRRVSRGDEEAAVVEAELKLVEEATGEKAESFWNKFKQTARKDLCEEGGMLYEQYRSWRDITSKDLVQYSSGVLLGLGLSGAPLLTAVVAVSAVTLHLGVRTICDS